MLVGWLKKKSPKWEDWKTGAQRDCTGHFCITLWKKVNNFAVQNEYVFLFSVKEVNRQGKTVFESNLPVVELYWPT